MIIPSHRQFVNHRLVEYGDYELRDSTQHSRILIRIRDSDRYSADYYVQDNETPMMLAQDFYGDPGLFWILLNLNDIVDPWIDWPMNHLELLEHTKDKYQIDDPALTMMWGWEGVWYREHEIINAVRDIEAVTSVEYFKNNADLMSYYDYESYINERKRFIRVIRPEQLSAVLDEYKDSLKP